jgi:hypothetical protein
MQIEIDEAIIDQIIKKGLHENVDFLKKDIKRLKRLKSRQPYEDEDLKDMEKILLNIEAVYDYFGGNIK